MAESLPPGSGSLLEPMLFEILLPHHALHSILSEKACSTVGIKHRRRRGQLLEPASGFLAARAIAGAGQNRRAECLEFHLATLAYRGKVFVLLLVQCDFPFLGPI